MCGRMRSRCTCSLEEQEAGRGGVDTLGEEDNIESECSAPDALEEGPAKGGACGDLFDGRFFVDDEKDPRVAYCCIFCSGDALHVDKKVVCIKCKKESALSHYGL